MANLIPANNIQLATVAGFSALLIEHLCQSNGITIPTDIADALPGVMAIIVAHIYDCFTGENTPPKPPAA